MSTDNITLTKGGTTINLPPDMQWEDIYTWSPMRQIISPSTTGALLIQMNAMIAGRPITLKSETENGAYIAPVTKATVDALRAIESPPPSPEAPMVLEFTDGRTFNVIFRYDSNSPAIDATAIKMIDNPENPDLYQLTLSLIQV